MALSHLFLCREPMKKIEYPSTFSGMYEHLKARVGRIVPDAELRVKAEMAVEINRLKREKNAVILAIITWKLPYSTVYLILWEIHWA